MHTGTIIRIGCLVLFGLQSSWNLVAPPYSTNYQGHSCVVIAFSSPDGRVAQVLCFEAADAPPLPALHASRWRTLSGLPQGVSGQWADCGWGVQAVVNSGGETFFVTVRPAAGQQAEAVRSVFQAAVAWLERQRSRRAVADVRARPVSELAAERWVAPLAELASEQAAGPWTRPDGIVSRVAIGADGGPEGPSQTSLRLPAGVRRISFAADIRGARPHRVRVVWYLDGRPVRASQTVARPGGRIVGWLTAEHGLPAGRYRVEIQSSKGVEARAEVLLVPTTPGPISSSSAPR